MKKLSLILCLVLFVTMFAGCGGKGDGKDSAGAANDGIFSTAAVNYKDADGKANYSVVRAENSSEESTAAALLIFQQFKKQQGLNIKNINDSNDGADKYEILIGDTNRPESAQVKQWLEANVGGRYLDYVIATVGKKIVIQAISQEGIANASQYFVENYLKADTVKGGIKYVYKTEGNFENLTVNGVPFGKFVFVRPHYNSSFMTYDQIEKLIDSVCQKTGYKPAINDDTITTESEYEIIVGDCARPNVTKIENDDEYKVTISGKKIYVNGGNHPATTIAVAELAKKMAGKTELTDADSFSGSYSQTVATYDPATYYTPKFWDDFDVTTGDTYNANGLDTNKWKLTTESSTGKNGYKATRSTDPSRVYVADGLFQIHPYFDYDTNTYYGGFLRSQNQMDFTYGYIEYSARIPDGPGFWTALWLRCSDHSGSSRPEIDIAESFGNSKTYAFNLHTWPGDEAERFGVTHTSLDGGKYPDKKKYCPDNKRFNDDFHTFGMLWTPEVAWATCDGVPYFKYTMGDKETDSWCFGKLMNICISMAVGFESCEGDPLTASQEVWENNAVYLVDWIYVYQLDDNIQKMVFYK